MSWPTRLQRLMKGEHVSDKPQVATPSPKSPSFHFKEAPLPKTTPSLPNMPDENTLKPKHARFSKIFYKK